MTQEKNGIPRKKYLHNRLRDKRLERTDTGFSFKDASFSSSQSLAGLRADELAKALPENLSRESQAVFQLLSGRKNG